MAKIRPLEREDLPAVAKLVLRHLPGWAAMDDIEGFLAATVIDDPWADEELPALVATAEGGEIVGYVGAQVRHMHLRDRSLRGVCICNCVVSAEHRGDATGAFMIRRMMSGAQDLSWSDQATYEITRLWRAFGGEVDYQRICDWMLVLRPFRWLASGVRGVAGRKGVGREEVPVGAMPLQAVGRRALPRAHPPLEAGVEGEDATSAAIVAAIPDVMQGSWTIDYDEPFLDFLFAQIETLRGPVTRRIVRREGKPIGWYAYVSDTPTVSRVLQLCAFDPDADAVLAELVEHARSAGRAAVAGRLEPHLVGALRRRVAVLGIARQPTIHARDPELRAEMAIHPPFLSQFDSEWFVTRTQVFSSGSRPTTL